MEHNISNYEDYFLIKCFKQKEYRDSFNEGNIYLSSLSYFHTVENEFQQDKEGRFFHQKTNEHGSLYIVNTETNSIISNLIKNGKNDQGIKLLKTNGKKIGKTTDFAMNINGYLCCFYIIQKKCLKISQMNIDIFPKEEYDNFFLFLNNYAKDIGYTFFSIYDAAKMIEKMNAAFSKNDYIFSFSCVDYADIDESAKIKWFLDNEIQKIVFTKPCSFSYQKEFRFFITPKKACSDASLTVKTDSFHNEEVLSLAYLTRDYYIRKIQRSGDL